MRGEARFFHLPVRSTRLKSLFFAVVH